MRELYKKTFGGMQLLIAAVTFGVLVWSRVFGLAVFFFLAMQMGALIGAVWGARLKSKVQRSASALPMRGE
jgi:hypothetical protein